VHRPQLFVSRERCRRQIRLNRLKKAIHDLRDSGLSGSKVDSAFVISQRAPYCRIRFFFRTMRAERPTSE
jgi:hypothetical protein